MGEITLSEVDRHFLRGCPRRTAIHRAAAGQSLAAEQYTRLRNARLVRGTIDSEQSTRDLLFMDVVLTNAGRRAIGLPIYEVDHDDEHA